MPTPLPATLRLSILLFSTSPAVYAGAGNPALAPHHPPQTPSETKTETLFGQAVSDPYRWLEDGTKPEVRAWADQQDRVARQRLDGLPGRGDLVRRLRELVYVDAISAPIQRGDRLFYTRRSAEQEKAVIYWKHGEKGTERVLLDPHQLSQDGSVSLGVWAVSLSGKKVAYARRINNADAATLYVRDVDTGEDSQADVIPGARYASPQWLPDDSGFYYTYLPDDPAVPVHERPGTTEIRFHRLGAEPKSDTLISPRTGNPEVFLQPGVSRDGQWLFRYRQRGWNHTEIDFRRRDGNPEDWTPLAGEHDASYSVIAWKDRFYVTTDEGAPRGRVFVVKPGRPGRQEWREIIAEEPAATLESSQIVGGRLVLTYLRNAASEVRIHNLDGTLARKVELSGIGSVVGVSGSPERPTTFITFQSFTVPTRIYRTSVRSTKLSLWSELKLPIDDTPFTVEQVWYPSRDGTRISMFVVRRKDMPRDGSTPMHLYGYGGFNVSMTPAFSAGMFAWLELGGAIALPNLRGGGEYGEEWHRAGMLDKKQNVFDDFIAAAEYLIREGYTRPARLAIRGGSNGGLLVGAAMVQRPDLFGAVICGVPLLDMVRYHLFGSGRTWVPEYGSPEIEGEFRTLFAYSPYHHLAAGKKYPALLMQSADSDDRVDPMHARKFVARLQALAGPQSCIMTVERNAGHGGADLRRAAVEQAADTFAFMLDALGVDRGRPSR